MSPVVHTGMGSLPTCCLPILCFMSSCRCVLEPFQISKGQNFVGGYTNMSRVDAWIAQMPNLTDKEFRSVHQAVMKENERREDQKAFSRFRRKSLPADIRDELSSEDSPGEFKGQIQHFLERMVQAFEMQTTRLRIEQLQVALQLTQRKGRRPTFKRSFQFSSEAISLD